MREQKLEYLTRDEVAKTLRVSTRTSDRIVADVSCWGPASAGAGCYSGSRTWTGTCGGSCRMLPDKCLE